jgi:hypothetical protein
MKVTLPGSGGEEAALLLPRPPTANASTTQPTI